MKKINLVFFGQSIANYRLIFLFIFLFIFSLAIISCDNFYESRGENHLQKIDDKNPLHVLHVCGKSKNEYMGKICFILKNEKNINQKSCDRKYENIKPQTHEDLYNKYNKCIIHKCYISIYPYISDDSGYNIINNNYPKFRVDKKNLPDFSLMSEYEIPGYQPRIRPTWNMERIFLSLSYTENREYIYYGSTEDIERAINNMQEALGDSNDPGQREDLIILENMKKGDEERFERKIAESINDLPHLRNILNGEKLYVTVLLDSGDVVEIEQPIQPIRDILLDERPCGMGNDFDLLDEITS